MKSKSNINFLHILERNGWTLCNFDEQESEWKYTMELLSADYCVTMQASVGVKKTQGRIVSYYGVTYLEIISYENDFPLCECEIDDMKKAFEYAEDNLLAIGCPFCGDYKFHGKNRANKKRRNDALRKKYNLEELELVECKQLYKEIK